MRLLSAFGFEKYVVGNSQIFAMTYNRGHACIVSAAALLTVGSLGCARTEARPKPSLPFENAAAFRIVSPVQGRSQRFVLKSSGGPVTVFALGGPRRGSDLRLELITPVEILIEPGTIEATAIAVGESTSLLRAVAVGDGRQAEGAVIEISRRSIYAHCCPIRTELQSNLPSR